MTTCKIVLALMLSLILGGCVTNTVTNLTARQIPRNANGVYLFEVVFDSNQQSLRLESVQPQVLIGPNSYPMQPALKLKDRWEALIPITATNQSASYRYKFDYQYNRFGNTGSGSVLSQSYRLEIVDQ